MSIKTRRKQERNEFWQEYTQQLLTMLRHEKSSALTLEESQILGMLVSSSTSAIHFERLRRYFHWNSIEPSEKHLIEVYENDPDAALDMWLQDLQPAGIATQVERQDDIKSYFEELGQEVPKYVLNKDSF